MGLIKLTTPHLALKTAHRPIGQSGCISEIFAVPAALATRTCFAQREKSAPLVESQTTRPRRHTWTACSTRLRALNLRSPTCLCQGGFPPERKVRVYRSAWPRRYDALPPTLAEWQQAVRTVNRHNRAADLHLTAAHSFSTQFRTTSTGCALARGSPSAHSTRRRRAANRRPATVRVGRSWGGSSVARSTTAWPRPSSPGLVAKFSRKAQRQPS